MTDAEQLVQDNQGYVAALARQIAASLPAHADIDELMSWGYLGLVEAARRFDGSLGVAFTTFAYTRIRGSIFDGLRKMGLRRTAREYVDTERAKDELADELAPATAGSDDPEQIAGQLQRVFRSLGMVYLVVRSDGDEEPIDGVEAKSASDEASDRELVKRVKECMKRLPEKEAEVLRLHYYEGLSMTDIAARFNVHKATISRLHADVLETLRMLIEPIAAARGP